jgi:hypothetical protein
MQDFRFLRGLGTVYAVFAWLGVLGGIVVLLTSRISDETRLVGYGQYASTVTDKGIGAMGVLSILAGVALNFVIFMGLSQMVRLLLGLDEKATASGRRLAETAIVLAEMRASQTKTAEHVRMVGEIVYEDAKK